MQVTESEVGNLGPSRTVSIRTAENPQVVPRAANKNNATIAS